MSSHDALRPFNWYCIADVGLARPQICGRPISAKEEIRDSFQKILDRDAPPNNEIYKRTEQGLHLAQGGSKERHRSLTIWMRNVVRCAAGSIDLACTPVAVQPSSGAVDCMCVYAIGQCWAVRTQIKTCCSKPLQVQARRRKVHRSHILSDLTHRRYKKVFPCT
jgi:hypothetical protein